MTTPLQSHCQINSSVPMAHKASVNWAGLLDPSSTVLYVAYFDFTVLLKHFRPRQIFSSSSTWVAGDWIYTLRMQDTHFTSVLKSLSFCSQAVIAIWLTPANLSSIFWDPRDFHKLKTITCPCLSVSCFFSFPYPSLLLLEKRKQATKWESVANLRFTPVAKQDFKGFLFPATLPSLTY